MSFRYKRIFKKKLQEKMSKVNAIGRAYLIVLTWPMYAWPKNGLQSPQERIHV